MVRIVEVGPRDGLQNEAEFVPTEVKAEFVQRLAAAGLGEIEATSFVSPQWVPQMADSADLSPHLPSGPLYSSLVPNLKGLERALKAGFRRIAVFTAASESFTLKNTNMTLDQSIAACSEVVAAFRAAVPDGFVRGYVSTAFECPYEGLVSTARVVDVCNRLVQAGIDEVSLGDTIGVATPPEVRELAKSLAVPQQQVAWHFHDTRGTALANVQAALDLGFTAFDSSAGGLGGCPFAPGAGGNLATEDLAYMLAREGLLTGIDLQRLAEASLPVLQHLGRQPASRAQQALLAACR